MGRENMKANNKYKTATEIILIKDLKRHSYMVWLMSKALVEGKVNSTVLRYAEEIYNSQKDIYENK